MRRPSTESSARDTVPIPPRARFPLDGVAPGYSTVMGSRPSRDRPRAGTARRAPPALVPPRPTYTGSAIGHLAIRKARERRPRVLDEVPLRWHGGIEAPQELLVMVPC
jgi:hypothetical protein